MQDPFVVAFVVGVTPTKWARIWGERMSRPLELRPLPQDAALAALADGSAHVALVRLGGSGSVGCGPVGSDPGGGSAGATGPTAALPAQFSAIPIYTEGAVVIAPKEHAVTAFESLTPQDLAGEAVLEPHATAGEAVLEPHATAGEAVLEPDWAGLITLVAANVGLAVIPQPVARALSRRDVTAIPITGSPETRIALVWVTARQLPETEEFIGIVRGRTVNSSRGVVAEPAHSPKTPKSGSATLPRRDPRASRAHRR